MLILIDLYMFFKIIGNTGYTPILTLTDFGLIKIIKIRTGFIKNLIITDLNMFNNILGKIG